MTPREIHRNAFSGDFIERGAWMLYDWVHFGAGWMTPERSYLFGGPRDHSLFHPVDTNIQLANRLPEPQAFSAYSIHPVFATTTADDKEAYRSRYLLEFSILQKIYYQAPLIAIPESGRRVASFRRFDRSAPRPGQFGEYPHVIPSGVPFRVLLDGRPVALSNFGSGLHLCVALNGVLDRAIQ